MTSRPFGGSLVGLPSFKRPTGKAAVTSPVGYPIFLFRISDLACPSYYGTHWTKNMYLSNSTHKPDPASHVLSHLVFKPRFRSSKTAVFVVVFATSSDV